MSRLPRLELARRPHLVVQAVAPGERLYRDEVDAQALCQALLEASRQHEVAVHAYALLDDSFHLLATPAQAGGLGLFMQAVGRRYVAGYNRRHARQGALWAGRFRATVLDPAQYLLEAMVYIEQHPWRRGVVNSPHAVVPGWPSSLAHHLGQCTDPLVLDHAEFWATGNTPFEREAAWRARLTQGQGASLVQTLQDATRKGWALGGDDFVAQGQAQTGRRLLPRPRGRPRKVVLPLD
jgi:putative transposase